MVRLGFLLLAAAMTLSACGSSTGDRTASGAGIGVTAGAVVGAVTGLSVVEGVLIGAAAGGIIGAVTDEDDIDLGKPVWESDSSSNSTPNTASSSAAGSARNDMVMRVQQGLDQLGYDPGPVDGLYGPKTTDAIRRYQGDHGLLTDGRATAELVEHIEQQVAG